MVLVEDVGLGLKRDLFLQALLEFLLLALLFLKFLLIPFLLCLLVVGFAVLIDLSLALASQISIFSTVFASRSLLSLLRLPGSSLVALFGLA